VIDSGYFNVTHSGTSHPTFHVNYSSSNGIRLELGPDLYNVGLDNVVYSGVAAVPEPATMTIWGLGALGIGFVVRRKNKLAAPGTSVLSCESVVEIREIG